MAAIFSRAADRNSARLNNDMIAHSRWLCAILIFRLNVFASELSARRQSAERSAVLRSGNFTVSAKCLRKVSATNMNANVFGRTHPRGGRRQVGECVTDLADTLYGVNFWVIMRSSDGRVMCGRQNAVGTFL